MFWISSVLFRLRSVFCALLLVICVSFVIQSIQIQALLTVEPETYGIDELQSASLPGSHAAALFGVPVSRQSSHRPFPHLRLLACFVQVDSRESIALIAVDDNPPRRLREGEEVAEGVYLQHVEGRRVILSRNDQLIGLNLQGLLTDSLPQKMPLVEAVQ